MLVDFRNVSKNYPSGLMALRGINLTIDRGDFVLLVGPSGAGKTTIMKMIYMDEYPTRGEVIVGRYSSKSMSPRKTAMLRRQVGVVFQEFRLLKELTVFENIALPLRAVGKRQSEIKKRVSNVLYSVGLSSKRHQFPLKLSGGEQQRVAIARAMVLRPPILLADEPTGNLDSATGNEIMGIFDELNQAGNTILLVTHEDEMARHANRVIHLRDGLVESDVSNKDAA